MSDALPLWDESRSRCFTTGVKGFKLFTNGYLKRADPLARVLNKPGDGSNCQLRDDSTIRWSCSTDDAAPRFYFVFNVPGCDASFWSFLVPRQSISYIISNPYCILKSNNSIYIYTICWVFALFKSFSLLKLRFFSVYYAERANIIESFCDWLNQPVFIVIPDKHVKSATIR